VFFFSFLFHRAESPDPARA